MTTPAERMEAVKIAQNFAEGLADTLAGKFARQKTEIVSINVGRHEWASICYMLRHLPTLGELELTHDKCPELWGKP